MVKQEKATLTMPDVLKNKARVAALPQGKNLFQVVRELLQLWLESKIRLPPPSAQANEEES
jgi:hypothetical protein